MRIAYLKVVESYYSRQQSPPLPVGQRGETQTIIIRRRKLHSPAAITAMFETRVWLAIVAVMVSSGCAQGEHALITWVCIELPGSWKPDKRIRL